MVEFAKEKIPCKLVDDTDTEVVLYKYINMPQKQELLRKHTEKIKMRGSDLEWIIDFPPLYSAVLNLLFVKDDNDFKTEDIVPESINSHIGQKVKSFLSMGLESKESASD